MGTPREGLADLGTYRAHFSSVGLGISACVSQALRPLLQLTLGDVHLGEFPRAPKLHCAVLMPQLPNLRHATGVVVADDDAVHITCALLSVADRLAPRKTMVAPLMEYSRFVSWTLSPTNEMSASHLPTTA